MSSGPAADERRTIVVVEDDPSIADLVALYLRQAGFEVAAAGDAAAGAATIERLEPCLVVLDLGLPGPVDGLELCRRLRAASRLPIVVLTARGDEIDRIVGLELGADDYVTKPFSPRELVARIKAVLRRSDPPPPGSPSDGTEASAATHSTAPSAVTAGTVSTGTVSTGTVSTGTVSTGTVSTGTVTVDLGRREVTESGRIVAVTSREYDLLVYLIRNTGLALSRAQILDGVWGPGWYGDERTIDVHVRQLRAKLGAGLPLITVRGLGYRLG